MWTPTHIPKNDRAKIWRGHVCALLAVFSVLAFVACAEGSQRVDERRRPLRDFLKQRRAERQAGREAVQSAVGAYNVGYTVISVKAPLRGGGKGSVDVAVWYPTRSDEANFAYVYGDNRVKTKLAVDGAVADGEFPFLLYSHGATGCGLSSAFLTEELARHGFIVAAPDYTDEHYFARIRQPVPSLRKLQELRIFKWAMDLGKEKLAQPAKVARKEFAYRPAQAQAAIDHMVRLGKKNGTRFSDHIDDSKIGLVGHSFGAWTTMLVGGADKGMWDKRVKAIAPLSGPVNNEIYSDSDMKRIRVPMMFMYGEKEAKHRNDDKAILYDRAKAPKFLLEIKGADHFTFSGGVSHEHDTMSQYLSKDRRRAAITQYTVSFFEYYLKGDQESYSGLTTKQSTVDRFLMDLG